MMSKSSQVHLRIETNLKSEAEQVLHELGITPTQAMTMFYKAIAREHAIPLVLKIPNKKTRKVLEESDKEIDINTCKDYEDFCKQTGIDD